MSHIDTKTTGGKRHRKTSRKSGKRRSRRHHNKTSKENDLVQVLVIFMIYVLYLGHITITRIK